MSVAFCEFVVNDIFYVLYAENCILRCQRNFNPANRLHNRDRHPKLQALPERREYFSKFKNG